MTNAQIIKKQQQEIEELKMKIALQSQQIKELMRMLLGRKSERHISSSEPDVDQLKLFEVEEDVANNELQEKEDIAYTRRKKKHPGRHGIPDHLPVEETTIQPDVNVEGMVKIGEEITESVEYTPGKLVKKRLIRPKYLDPQTQIIYIADMPSRPIPKSIAESGLISHIAVSKYVDHIPLYRQAKMFYRDYNWNIPKNTLVGWIGSICMLLEPLYNALKQEILDSEMLQVDETPIKVLEYNTSSGDPPSKKRNKILQGYQWVYLAPTKNLVLFDYQPSRSEKAARKILSHCTAGFIQCDGYQVYDSISEANKNIILLGCLAHARRYFEKALDSDPKRANFVLNSIKAIYLQERKAKQLNDLEAHQEIRDKEIVPKLKMIKKWVDEEYEKVLPKSKIGAAMYYFNHQYPKLLEAAENAKFQLDNNLVENKIRPLALGRKNYLFAGSHKGAQRAAMLYSFFGSCISCGINPRQWLKQVLDKIPDHPINKIHQLLPNNIILDNSDL